MSSSHLVMFRSALPVSAVSSELAASLRVSGRIARRVAPLVLATAGLGAMLASTASFAQNSPGVPGGILDYKFQINQHPDMPFAASAPSAKYQNGKPSEARKRADDGDPNGCNLKCGPGN